MDTAITAIYCLPDDFLKATGHRDDAHVTMSDAEVITTALMAARFFGGNFELACQDLHKPTSSRRCSRRASFRKAFPDWPTKAADAYEPLAPLPPDAME